LHGNYHGNWSEPGQVGYGFAALFENGDAVLYGVSSVSASVFLGQWRVTGSNRFAFDVTGYSVLGGVEHTSGTGNFNEEGLTATTTAGGELFATLMPSFQHSLSTADLAGNYDIHDWNNVVIGSVTIQSNGTVTGTTYSGCNVNGTFSVPNANFNQAYIFAEISVCVATASGSGAAVYRNELNEIVIAAADGLYGYVWTLK
jgi:hypothetical protein